MSDQRVYFPLRVKCRSSAEFNLLCAVDEGDSPEAEFLLRNGGMGPRIQACISYGEDLLALSISVPHSALGSQPVALVACTSNVTAEVPTPLQAQEDQTVINLQATPFEVGDQLVITPNELRRFRVY